jgi:uncharacterized protein
MRILYLDGERLRRSLVAACDYVQHCRAELNRINVYPVPDGDTGTNLSLTVAAVSDRMRMSRSASVGVVAREAADAAILGARGNCGMILSHFLLGFSDSVETRERLDVREFGVSLDAAVRHVYRSLERPVEGTIVTVMREVAEEAEHTVTSDFADLLERLLARAQASLARTPELLPALRKAGVVDAGAKGFVHMMEGVSALLRGEPFAPLEQTPDFPGMTPAAAALAEYPAESERYRFCTEALVRGDTLPGADQVRATLRDRGDSLIVLGGSDVLKIHIHTDEPDAVFAYLRTFGQLVTHKAEDMAAQHAAVGRAARDHVQLARRPFSFVTDSACNLPDEITRAHGIHVVPLSIVVGEGVLRDGIDIDAAAFAARLRSGEQPTTSQPPPAAFLEAYRRAAEDGETVLGVILGSALSGTFSSAQAAARQLPGAMVRLFDSRAAGLTQGFLLLKAAELAEAGADTGQIERELERIRAQSGVFFTVEVFDNLLASGRVGRGKVMIAGLLDIKPILTLDATGRVLPLDRVRGSRRVPSRMLDLLEQRVPRTAKQLRFGIMHVDRPQIGEELGTALEQRWGARETIVAPATAVLATHLGPGAWGLAWQLED